MSMLETKTNILLMSEDATHRAEIYDVLHGKDNYQLLMATNFAECLLQIEKKSPAIVFVDMRKKPAFSSDICVRIRNKFGGDIILLAVILDDVESLQQALTAQVDDCILWPMSPVLLQRRINSFLRVRRNMNTDTIEDKYQHLFNSANDAIFIVDMTSGQFLDANRRAIKWLGYSYDEFLQMVYADIEVASQEQLQGVNQQLSSTGHFIFEQEYRAKSGTIFPSEVSSRIFSYEGKRAVLNFVRDISKRKIAEKEAEHQRLLAETLRDVAAVLSSTLNIDEVIKLILQHVVRVVPAPTANIMLIEEGKAQIAGSQNYGKHMDDTILREYSLDVVKTYYIKWMVEHLRPIVLPDTHDDPNWSYTDKTEWIRSYVAAPIIIGDEVVGFINLDHTKRLGFSWDDAEDLMAFAHHASIAVQNARLHESVKQHASELEERVIQRTHELNLERARLDAILNAITDGVIYQDEESMTGYVNQALVNLTGYSSFEWIEERKDWHELTVDLEPVMARRLADIHSALKLRGTWIGETKLLRKDQSKFDARLVVSNVVGSDNRPIGMVTVIQDISAAKHLAEQKARFIGTASHELRTPITNIKTRLYLIQKQPDRIEEHLAVLKQVTQHMGKLVEDLLDVSRFERGGIPLERRVFVLQDLINNVLHVQTPEMSLRNLHLVSNLYDVPLQIWGDQSRLLQVLTNLISNAVNFTPSGGTITVGLTLQQQDTALITICDTGIGISQEQIDHIFTPFFRVNDDGAGTGLGLAITKELLEMHNGQITVTSALNQGTCFNITLPLYTGEA